MLHSLGMTLSLCQPVVVLYMCRSGRCRLMVFLLFRVAFWAFSVTEPMGGGCGGGTWR